MILIFFFVMSIITFILFGIDKQKAKKGKWRIRESVLLGFSAIGGSFGAFLGMWIFAHKITKPKFSMTIPILTVVHAVLIYALTVGF